MNLVWVGAHFEGLDAFRGLLESGIRFEAAFTLNQDSAAKRSGSADYRPICEQYKVPLNFVSDINSPETIEQLRRLQIDVGIVIGWSQILRWDALSASRFGWIGAHASMLPKNRGSAPVNWALINGETETGNSLIWLSEGVDEGNLIAQRPIEISAFDTCRSIYERIGDTNQEMLLEVVPKLIEGHRISRPQPISSEPPLPRRRPKDGLIDWGQQTDAVYNFVRALTQPYPGAFSFLDGQQYTIWEAAILPVEKTQTTEPGQLIGPMISPVEQSCGQLVACGDGVLAILDVEDSGGNRLNGPELAMQQWQGKRWQRAA